MNAPEHSPETPEPSAAPVAPPSALPSRRWGTRLAGMLLGLPLLSGIGLGAAWHWSAQEGSLASALQVLHWVPGLQALQLHGVQGNLRSGGQVGRLQWQQAGLQLDLQDLQLPLHWSRLWQGQLPLTRLQIGQLKGQYTSATQAPARPPASLALPLQVDMPWQIGRVEWGGSTAVQTQPLLATELRGHYRYSGAQHTLRVENVQWAQGQYSGELQLQARAPMQLNAQLRGHIEGLAEDVAQSLSQGRVKGNRQGRQPDRRPPLVLQAEARLEGPLARMQDRLTMQAKVERQGQAVTAPPLLTLQAEIQPWQAPLMHAAQMRMQQLDLAALWPGAPLTRLSGEVQVRPSANGWDWQTRLSNDTPGPWDRQRLPLRQLSADLSMGSEGSTLHRLNAQIGPGTVTAQGAWQAGHWQGRMQLQQLQPGLVHSAFEGPSLSGPMLAEQMASGRVQVKADLRPDSGPVAAPATGRTTEDHLQLLGQWSAERWTIERLSVRLAGAMLQANGSWAPARRLAEGELQLQIPGLQASAQGRLGPEEGEGQARLDSTALQQAQTWLQRWPALAQGLPALPLSGDAQLRLAWQGGWSRSDSPLQAELRSNSLSLGAGAAPSRRLQAFHLQVQGTPAALQAQLRSRWQPDASGTPWQLESQLQARRPDPEHAPLRWEGQWQQARLERPDTPSQDKQATATIALQLQQAVNWQWHADSALLQWSAMRWHLLMHTPTSAPSAVQAAGPARLELDSGQWRTREGAGGEPVGPVSGPLQARLQDLPVAWATALGWPQLQGGLQLRGELQLRQLQPLELSAALERQTGDVAVRADLGGATLLQAGVREAAARLRMSEALAELQLDWASEQAGQAQARLQARRNPGQDWAQAALGGQVQAQWPRVGAWSWLAPPGWRVQGSMDARFEVAGTLAQPRWDGRLQADQLALRSAVQGVEFSQGQLQARLQDQRMVLERLSLRGAGAQGGELSGEGELQWLSHSGSTSLRDVRMDLRLQARGLRVSNRADRRLAVSGDVQARLERGQMRLRGRVQADQAWFVLPEDSTPRLGDDVRVDVKVDTPKTGSRPVAPTGPSLMDTPDVQLTLDLGPDFQLRGMGVNTRLAGSLQLASSAATLGLPRLSGEVRTEGGRYQAYGQQLEIEQGVLRFAGAYDNPALDILALRPNISQRVGVRVSGTARAPRIRLYADPEMPDADKLAWLVLGRSPGGGGAESAVLQQAALALLGGSGKGLGTELANALGLDTIGIAPSSTENATGAAITLGKRLSKDFYLAYESSVNGTFGSLFIFYDLSRRLTLRAQAGDLNALDLIYTVRKD